jgi:formylglycine-generating enzyme required for sulfatase activity
MSRKACIYLALLSGSFVVLALVAPGAARPYAPGPLSKLPLKTIINSIGMRLVRIPPGKFKMGSTKKEREDMLAELKVKEMPYWLKAEGPQHDLEITKEFWLGIHELTQKQFMDVMGDNPSYFSFDGKGKPGVEYKHWPAGGKEKVPVDTRQFPVDNVCWAEANEFCKKLTASDKRKPRGWVYRLPTEAEWEYACRGGATTYQVFHFGNSLSSKQANFVGDFPYGDGAKGPNLGRTCEVGSYQANNFGLFDMHGNVMEWCRDWYDDDYYAASARKDPTGPTEGSWRVLRGGMWGYGASSCRTAKRIGREGGYHDYDTGFRVVLAPARK